MHDAFLRDRTGLILSVTWYYLKSFQKPDSSTEWNSVYEKFNISAVSAVASHHYLVKIVQTILSMLFVLLEVRSPGLCCFLFVFLKKQAVCFLLSRKPEHAGDCISTKQLLIHTFVFCQQKPFVILINPKWVLYLYFTSKLHGYES